MHQKKKQRIYLDYASSTPLDTKVLKTMLPFLNDVYGNPSAIHYEGRIAKEAVSDARNQIAHIIGAHDNEIFFTGSGTESIALAIRGVLAKFPSCHIITSAIEHKSVLENIRIFEKKDYPVSYVLPNSQGIIDTKDIQKCIRPNTVLISLSYANNELGSIQPIAKIAKLINKERRRRSLQSESLPILFHVDACQAAGYLDISIQNIHADLLTINGSKLYGPKGVGVLYKRNSVQLEPLWSGGGQEQGLRSGTEHVAGIVGIAEALKLSKIIEEKEKNRLSRLRDYFISMLQATIPSIYIISIPQEYRMPNIVHVIFSGISGELLTIYLDNAGIAVSSQSACATTTDIPSHVILAVGLTNKEAKEGIRFSFGRKTTKKELDYTVLEIQRIALLLRNTSDDV